LEKYAELVLLSGPWLMPDVEGRRILRQEIHCDQERKERRRKKEKKSDGRESGAFVDECPPV